MRWAARNWKKHTNLCSYWTSIHCRLCPWATFLNWTLRHSFFTTFFTCLSSPTIIHHHHHFTFLHSYPPRYFFSLSTPLSIFIVLQLLFTTSTKRWMHLFFNINICTYTIIFCTIFSALSCGPETETEKKTTKGRGTQKRKVGWSKRHNMDSAYVRNEQKDVDNTFILIYWYTYICSSYVYHFYTAETPFRHFCSGIDGPVHYCSRGHSYIFFGGLSSQIVKKTRAPMCSYYAICISINVGIIFTTIVKTFTLTYILTKWRHTSDDSVLTQICV